MNLRINTTHTHKERGLDAYWTPPEATKALLRIENVPIRVWEPACGNGSIAKVLQGAGYRVITSDVVSYPGFCPDFVDSFLRHEVPGGGVDAIVTNPPFRLAADFAAKAIADAHYVALLLRLNFLESVERLRFFREHPPSRIWVSSRRLPMMHRLGYEGPKSSSNQAFGWFIWDWPRPPHVRCPALCWFDWGEGADEDGQAEISY